MKPFRNVLLHSTTCHFFLSLSIIVRLRFEHKRHNSLTCL